MLAYKEFLIEVSEALRKRYIKKAKNDVIDMVDVLPHIKDWGQRYKVEDKIKQRLNNINRAVAQGNDDYLKLYLEEPIINIAVKLEDVSKDVDYVITRAKSDKYKYNSQIKEESMK